MMGELGIIIMCLLLVVFGGYVSVVTSDTQLSYVLGHGKVDYNKTGFVEDAEFLGGGFMNPTKTLIRYTNGDVVTLQGWKTEIPKKAERNVTLP